MTKSRPWRPHEHPAFDTDMRAACGDLMVRLAADRAFRRSILADPRDLHRTLYARFAPTTHPDYAGVYRGEPGTSLAFKRSGAASALPGAKPTDTFAFVEPEAVSVEMACFHAEMGQAIDEAKGAPDPTKLATLAYGFAGFGAIHPFLDGNGHIQRALFAAAAMELEIPLSARFAIHPRSYDLLLTHALQIFTTRPELRVTWLVAIAEYLAQWLGGPFDRPGSGLAPI